MVSHEDVIRSVDVFAFKNVLSRPSGWTLAGIVHNVSNLPDGDRK
jgi:hypothetical protein